MGWGMRKNIANIITGIRIAGSVLLAFLPVFSAAFCAVYLICGLSDMADGAAARKTDSSSSFGARLDTAADLLFAAVSFVRLLPHISLPGWLWIWIAVIALIRAANAVWGFSLNKKPVSVHSVMNKITGLLLFLFPLTLGFIEPECSAVILCSIAAASAVQEGYFIGTGRALVMQRERSR